MFLFSLGCVNWVLDCQLLVNFCTTSLYVLDGLDHKGVITNVLIGWNSGFWFSLSVIITDVY